MSLFGKSLNAKDAIALVGLASQDYWKKVIENAPDESDLKARQDYLQRAYHEAVGLDYLAQYLHDYLNEPSVSLASAAAIANIREAIKYNEEKLNS